MGGDRGPVVRAVERYEISRQVVSRLVENPRVRDPLSRDFAVRLAQELASLAAELEWEFARDPAPISFRGYLYERGSGGVVSRRPVSEGEGG